MHDISFFMKELKMRFTIYFNKKYNRFGTLWAERFKSLLVESNGPRNAVLAVAAYIDLNPVRAGLCGDPKDYRFCGYAKAVGGDREARRGLAWIIDRASWREVLREYRMVLFGAGVMSDRSKAGGIDWEASRAVLQAGGKVAAPGVAAVAIPLFQRGGGAGITGVYRTPEVGAPGLFGEKALWGAAADARG